jgi:hypothetical protein
MSYGEIRGRSVTRVLAGVKCKPLFPGLIFWLDESRNAFPRKPFTDHALRAHAGHLPE